MTLFTWAEIKEKVKRRLDIEEEDFMSDTELLDIANEAIDEIEAEIHDTYEDYYLTSANIAMVAGTQDYDLPSDIYAQKIRSVQYKESNTFYYEMMPININEIMDVEDSEDYRYMLINTASSGQKLRLYPAARVSAPTYITVWYYRNAKRLTQDSDICDIPEFVRYLADYLKVEIMSKDLNPMVTKAITDLEKTKQLMLRTLSRRVPDYNNRANLDTEIYDDMN